MNNTSPLPTSTPPPRPRKKRPSTVRRLVPSSSTVVSPEKKKRRGKQREEMNPEDLFYYQIVGAHLPLPEREYPFLPGRRFRFDFAWPHQDLSVAVEIEGGIWSRGRHIRPEGFLRDMEKYNHACLLSWSVYRFSTEQVRDGSALEFLKQALEIAACRSRETVYQVLPPLPTTAPKTGASAKKGSILSSGKTGMPPKSQKKKKIGD